MKAKILWLESALQDLEALSAKDIDLILRRVDLLSTFSFMGAPMLFDEWEGYRQLICGNQRVIYQVLEDGKIIEIAYIRHTCQHL
ncbi:MAG: type II toxin-antitoxin system RelE/ParE family toxin [Anaerolineales bacterium]|nr:MAG: type II toxin-antitoxin system RelE/ParE family toxin [Anaerolineales bacterium]